MSETPAYYRRYDCIPAWCGGTPDDPCATALETLGELHEDEREAMEEEEW